MLFRSLCLAALITTSAYAFTPSPQLQRYQVLVPKAQRNVPVWDAWKMQGTAVGKTIQLRGMVDGAMTFGHQRSVFIRVGTHRLQVDMGSLPFDVAPGTAVYGVATVVDTRQNPPAMRLEAVVRSEEMAAWRTEQDRIAALARSQPSVRYAQTVWTRQWASGNPSKQMDVACHWMQSFNPSLADGDARLWASTLMTDAHSNGLDPRLVMSLMAAESAYQADARSSVGAQGLGQLMPETATRLGVDNAYDPVQNIHGSTRYLGRLMSMWGSQKHPLSLVLASYNAGEGAVQQYGGIPPYAETQNYVSYVLSLYRELGGAGS
ncbi:MAG TPA: lytic transglycosylase domain-containing protein [Candidatus Xenobia bacterium]|jgi:hypothetical protein